MGSSPTGRRTPSLGALVAATDASSARKPTAAQLVTRDALVTSGRSFELALPLPRLCAYL
jgi:hypothetical protein